VFAPKLRAILVKIGPHDDAGRPTQGGSGALRWRTYGVVLQRRAIRKTVMAPSSCFSFQLLESRFQKKIKGVEKNLWIRLANRSNYSHIFRDDECGAH
jgi:hypothetical protein